MECKKSLYRILEVNEQSTTRQIRDAYRKAAKKDHPDKGGSIEMFALIKKAHDILTDEQRRAKYDATGDDSEVEPDKTMSQAINCMAAIFNQTCVRIEQTGRDPIHADVVKEMKSLIKDNINAAEQKRGQIEAAIKKTRKMLGRFKVKKGKQNFLEGMILSKISGAEQELKNLDDQLKPFKDCMDILKDFSFKFEDMPERQSSPYQQMLGGVRFVQMGP